MIVAFRKPGDPSFHWRNLPIRDGVLRVGARRYRIISHEGGAAELYAVADDGRETFVGYARETLPGIVKATERG